MRSSPPGETPRPGQIRDSNSHTLAALVRRYGGIPRPLGVARDTVADLTAPWRRRATPT
jgi:molybdopterin molybdotransferase